MERKIEFFGKDITIYQAWFSGELGGTIWDAALVLIKYLENVEEFPLNYFKGKTVVELGAGTGAVGIAAALLGGDVTITDQKQLVELIQTNIDDNNVSNTSRAMDLTWGEDNMERFKPPVNVILAADIVSKVYSPDFGNLNKTLFELSDESTRIILAYEKRDASDVEFFKMLSKNFKYSKVPDSKLDPKWRSDDIGIFEIRKLPEAERQPFDFKAWTVPWATTEVAKKDIVHPKPEDEAEKEKEAPKME